MIIDNNWTLASNTGLLIQKFGSSTLQLCYAESTPDGSEPVFTAQLTHAQQFPAVTGKAIYIRAFVDSEVSASFEEVA